MSTNIPPEIKAWLDNPGDKTEFEYEGQILDRYNKTISRFSDGKEYFVYGTFLNGEWIHGEMQTR